MKISWLKHLASYFYLVTIKKLNSDINPGLCLQMETGKLLLNTSNANYSYGNCHRVFEEVFEIIEIDKNPPENVLILGFGSGGIVDIMQRQYGFTPKITGVELDSAVIQTLQFWDRLDLSKTDIICGDAFKVIDTLNSKFDLIIVDLFIDLNVAVGMQSNQFMERLKFLTISGGHIIINYVVNTKEQKQQFAEFQILLTRYFDEIKGHEVMGMNRVLDIKMP